MTLTPALWQQLQALFNEALGLPIEKREAWLRAQVHVEEFLIERVITMLTADAQLEQIPEQSAASALIGEPEIRSGEKLGVYTIEKLIGAGGMGQVYLAARTDGVVAQQVAIKLLHGFGNTQELKRRFDQERRILARLQHPSIARFLDAGADKKGRPYVVMEFIDGASISDFCARQKLELPARLALFTQVLDAVVYAHAQLIVHRDIKPSNVLVDSSGQVRLLDFGIAKPLLDLDDSLRAGERTATAMRSFSMRYAAPEQLSGAATGVSCDIYALGGLLFELLTGNPPLDLDDKSFADAANAIQYTLPMLPSAHKDAPVSAKLLKGDLDRICLHALKKGPNERYASAEAFRRDIISVISREPISLRSGVASYRARKFIARYKLPVALAATLFLGLAASSTVLYLQQNRLKIERDRAWAEQQRAEHEQKRAGSVTDLLLSAFRAADPSQNRGEKLLAREVLDQAALSLEDASLDAASMVTLSTTLGSVYHSLGLHPNARKLVDHALAQASTAPAIEQAQLWHLNAALHLQADKRTERIAAIKQSALLLKDTDPLSPVGIRQQLLEIALVRDTGTLAEGLQRAKRLDEEVASRYGNGHALAIETAIVVLRYMGSFERDLEVTDLIEKRLTGKNLKALDPQQLMLLKQRALLHLDVGRIEEATQDIRYFGVSTKRLYGINHRNYASYLNLEATLAADKRDFKHSIEIYRQIVELIFKIEGESLTLALALNNESLALQDAGDYKLAMKSILKAINIVDKLAANDHNMVATLRTNLGNCFFGIGQLGAAEKEYLSAIAVYDRFYAEDPSADVAYSHVKLAKVLAIQRRFAEANKQICLANKRLLGTGKSIESAEVRNELLILKNTIPTYDRNLENENENVNAIDRC